MNVLDQHIGENFAVYHGDCIEVARALDTESVRCTLTSPPYGNIYQYHSSPRDMGNTTDDEVFRKHFKYLIAELLRVTMPGRHVVIDIMNVPAMKERDGYIGIKDLRGDIIRDFIAGGFIFHSETCCWKDPLIEATRSHALGLMHQQLVKDSAMSRMGFAQYLLTFRKPGENPEPVAHQNGLEWFHGEDPPNRGVLSHERWRRYASPVWMDINFTRTLNAAAAREEKDSRHICPMSLDLVERALHLWSNPGDLVFDPFTGIGSTGHVAISLGRKFVGSELKPSYFREAIKNIQAADPANKKQTSLFDLTSAGAVQ